MEKTLKITLVKSPIGAVPKQKATVEALGLKKLHQTVVKPDNEAVRGMIWHVKHLVKVEEALKRAITSEEVVDTDEEMVRQPVKVIKVGTLVPEHQDQALKVVRCHYTEDFQREVSLTETPKRSLLST